MKDVNTTVEQAISSALEKVLAREKQTIAELQKTAKILAEYAKETRGLADRELKKYEGAVDKIQQLAEKSVSAAVSKMKKDVDTTSATALKTLLDETKKMRAETQAAVNHLYDRVSRLKSGERGEQGEPGKSVDVDEVVSAVLSQLKMPEVKDYTNDIEKLVQSVEELRQRPVGRVQTPRYVWTPWVDDFTSQTDGSTKVFVLSKEPRNLNTIKGWGSDFPHILHINNDFSISRKTVTLNSTVPAPTQGSSLLFEYYT